MDYTVRNVSTFYDHLADGKLVGQHCNSCHGYQAFPAVACRHCQSTDLEAFEFSMKGKLVYCTNTRFAAGRFMKSGLYPMVFGAVRCDEGPVLMIPVLEGIRVKDVPEANQRCPLDVVLETREIGGNFIPVAKVVTPKDE
jgi:uncharacterized OB-fold protein